MSKPRDEDLIKDLNYPKREIESRQRKYEVTWIQKYLENMLT